VFVERRVGTERGVTHGSATHPFATLVLCTAGRVAFEQRSIWQLEAGEVLLIPAGEPHRRLASEDVELWMLGFCVPCFLEVDGGALLAPFERVRAGGSAVARIPKARRAFVEGLFREVELGRAAPASVQRSLLTLVLHEIAAHVPAVQEVGPGLVSDCLRFIEQNCLRPLTLAQIARAVNRSPAHVTTAIRRATGRSAVAWIVAGRMAEARRRLLHSDELVDVIAERVGYADATHFIRMFRRAHGQTPAAWRASHQR
jgi:AraC-like DNA-binding protein